MASFCSGKLQSLKMEQIKIQFCQGSKNIIFCTKHIPTALNGNTHTKDGKKAITTSLYKR